MSITNLNNRHFSTEEKTTINAAITSLETALSSNLMNLTPEERKQFGSVNEQNKLIINKVKNFYEIKPELASPDVNWEEFLKDYQTRDYIQDIIQRLQGIITGLESAKILHDWDNYQAALTDYGYTQYKKGSGATGYDAKIEELKQFFFRQIQGKSKTENNKGQGDL